MPDDFEKREIFLILRAFFRGQEGLSATSAFSAYWLAPFSLSQRNTTKKNHKFSQLPRHLFGACPNSDPSKHQRRQVTNTIMLETSSLFCFPYSGPLLLERSILPIEIPQRLGTLLKRT